MPHPSFITILIGSLLALSTTASAECLACPNCDYDNISPSQGNACLNYWTCSGDTITCYYPSVEYPGTYTACEWTGSGYDFVFTSGPSVCDTYIGVNSKCLPSNNPWNVGTNACTASYGYVGEYNSGLL